jgi:imidazolonepropionase-like amidohydrolase
LFGPESLRPSPARLACDIRRETGGDDSIMRLKMLATALAGVLAVAGGTAAESFQATVLPPPVAPGAVVKPFVIVSAGRIALTHVKLIDGTGAPAQADRTVILDGGRIAAVQPGEAPLPSGVSVIDLTGSTLLPGLVGMHDHLFHIARPNIDASGHSDPPVIVPQMTFSAPRLYLANGVTTIRTTGSVEPYTDLNIKQAVDAGEEPGPHMDVTGPYLEGPTSIFVQMHHLKDAEDARRTVAFWADQGATSFKAYMNITRAELKAAIEEAHRRGLKLTGHLCSVTYPEAVDLGIDDLEHGFFVNTMDDPGKTPDVCTSGDGAATLTAMDPDGAEATGLIHKLLDHHVALTSTLPAFEPEFSEHSRLYVESLAAMSPEARESYLYVRGAALSAPADRRAQRETMYRHGVAMEKRFFDAGGLLLAGPDPTSTGGIVPGFGDLREIELLVDGGFPLEQAVRVATLNGATYLGLQDKIGSVAPGKDADLLIVRGDPTKAIDDLANVQLVFKDGVGYDPQALIRSAAGRYGEY